MKIAAWNPLRLKNFVLVALALGILVGIWLGDFFKGFGWGPENAATNSPGDTPSSLVQQPGDDLDGRADLVGHHAEDASADAAARKPAGLVKVLIDDRAYFLRAENENEPIGLAALVELIGQTKPNDDGLKAVVERTSTSRVSAEVKLFDALKAAGVPENSVYLTPQAVE
jgi:hypothetical protein